MVGYSGVANPKGNRGSLDSVAAATSAPTGLVDLLDGAHSQDGVLGYLPAVPYGTPCRDGLFPFCPYGTPCLA